MTKQTKRVFIRCVALILVVFVGFVASTLYDAWHRFAVEDHIHATLYPVVRGLNEFQLDTGSAARDLNELAPNYIVGIPQLDLVDQIRYTRSPDGQNWELSLHSKALKPSRFYVARSNQEFTEAEQKRIIQKYHAIWTVLRE